MQSRPASYSARAALFSGRSGCTRCRRTTCSHAQVTCRVPSQARQGSDTRRRATVSLRPCAAAFGRGRAHTKANGDCGAISQTRTTNNGRWRVNRIARRIIMCMLLVAALTVIWILLGHAITAAHGRPSRDEHPQHCVTALAGLAETGQPLPGPVQQLCRVRARAESRDQEERRGVVRTQRRQTVDRLRRDLDGVQNHRDQS